MNKKLTAALLFAIILEAATGLVPSSTYSIASQTNHRPARGVHLSRRWSTVGRQDAAPAVDAAEPGLPGADLEALLAERTRQEASLADTNRRIWQASRDAASDGGGNVRAQARIEPQWDFEDYNFGFVSKSKGVYLDSVSADGQAGPPSNLALMAWRNLKREGTAMVRQLLRKDGGEAWLEPVANPDTYLVASFGGQAAFPDGAAALRRQGLGQLVLSNQAVHDREVAREANGSGVPSPWLLRLPYVVLCGVIDACFENRPLPRFWFLETVARMPYLSYISMLHLYESLGWWRRSADVKRIHFAEEWNEFHHLLVMEALGGDQRWSDRFLAQHAAVAYYFVLVALWLGSPSAAYNFSELIEAHAVDTYDEFRAVNAEKLAALPAPQVAKQYWAGTDLFLFDEFQSQAAKGSRRPTVNTLLDVFDQIALDEAAHVATMQACQNVAAPVRSPNGGPVALLTAGSLAAAAALAAQQAVELAAGGGLLVELAEADAAQDSILGVVGALAIEFELIAGQLALVAETCADAAAAVSSVWDGALAAAGAQLAAADAALDVGALVESLAEDGSLGESVLSSEAAADLPGVLEALPRLLEAVADALQGVHF